MFGVFESTLASNQTQVQSPPAVTLTAAAVSEILVVEPSPTVEVPSLTPVVEPSQTLESSSFITVAMQQQSDEQIRTAHTTCGFVDASVVFGAINSSTPTQVSIPPGAIILRHMRNTDSTWMKRKRGQPIHVGFFTHVMPQCQVQSQAVPPPPPIQLEVQPQVVDLASPSTKKARSILPSSINTNKMEALDSPGVKFIPHVIDVEAGEDVASKIMVFSQNGSRDVCILSAYGAISNVTIREPATPGGTVNYEGWYEILSLSGSFMMSKSGIQKRITGGISILFAAPDGTVLGGSVVGLLVAASPVQVIIGSYNEEESREMKSALFAEHSSAPPKFNYGGDASANNSQLHETLGESSGGAESPHKPSSTSGIFDNNIQSQ